MVGLALSYCLSRDVVKVIPDEFSDKVDDALDLLTCREGGVFTEAE